MQFISRVLHILFKNSSVH